MTAQDQQEILAQEDRLTRATQAIDVNALDRIYADTLIFTGVTGVVCNKRAVMDEARRGSAAKEASHASGPAIVGYDKDDLTAIRHGDTAVTSFRFGVTIRADGQDVTRKYRTTNVWMKRNGDWQVVAAHTAALG